jgi:D-alanyl-D-alanine carboxypeptidase
MSRMPAGWTGLPARSDGRRAGRRGLVVGVLLTVSVGAGCSATPVSQDLPVGAGPATSPAGTARAGSGTSPAGTTRGPGALSWPAPPTTRLPTATAASMQREMQRWIDKGLLPGVTAAVVTPQGVWSGAAGVDGAGTALVPTSGMALGGVTVTFTAAELMLLAEQGKVDLDAPASTYVRARQLANRVTVRQLMAQRAGIPDAGDGRYATAFAHLDQHWSPQDALAAVATATQAPGKEFHYDNTNYVLLGLVIDAARRTDTATALRKDLWEPLGLARLAYQDQEALAAPLARPGPDEDLPHGVPAGPVIPSRSVASAVGASGGVAGDAESTARWGYDLYGARLLTPESVAQLADFSDGDGYGLGTIDYAALNPRASIDGIGHPGGMPGYRSVLAVYPDQQVSVAILTPSTVDAVPYVKWLVKAGQLVGATP